MTEAQAVRLIEAHACGYSDASAVCHRSRSTESRPRSSDKRLPHGIGGREATEEEIERKLREVLTTLDAMRGGPVGRKKRALIRRAQVLEQRLAKKRRVKLTASGRVQKSMSTTMRGSKKGDGTIRSVARAAAGEKKSSVVAPKRRITVVSGGLPTLGRRHR
jgi:hypothetical protein